MGKKKTYTNKGNKLISESEIYTKIWKHSWLFLSAMMNAISLINIGNDLKIVIFRWISFFEVSFGFVRQITDILSYPFISFFSMFNITIPVLIKQTYFFTSLFISTFNKAHQEKNKKFKIGSFSMEQTYQPKTKWEILRFKISLPLTPIIGGFFAGTIISGICWILYLFIDNYAVYLINSLLLLLFIIISLPPTQKEESRIFFSRRIRDYILTVFIILFLLCISNYIYTVYKKS